MILTLDQLRALPPDTEVTIRTQYGTFTAPYRAYIPAGSNHYARKGHAQVVIGRLGASIKYIDVRDILTDGIKVDGRKTHVR